MWQDVNAVANLKVNPTIGINKVLQFVFIDKVLGYVGELDAYIFRAVKGGLEIEVPTQQRTFLQRLEICNF